MEHFGPSDPSCDAASHSHIKRRYNVSCEPESAVAWNQRVPWRGEGMMGDDRVRLECWLRLNEVAKRARAHPDERALESELNKVVRNGRVFGRDVLPSCAKCVRSSETPRASSPQVAARLDPKHFS